jgi:DNA excision repair protein ERCC-1
VQVDVPDPYPILKSLTHISILADLVLIPTNSAEEAGRIIENYKIYENKPADMIKEQKDPGLLQQVIDALTSIRSVNKTDAMTLLNVFGSLAHLLKADLETISICPGIGPKKAQLIYLSLREKFKLSK